MKKETQIINLTPHEIVVIANGVETRFPASGVRAVVKQESAIFAKLQNPDITVYTTVNGEVDGLPDYDPDNEVIYIVAGMVLSALAGSRIDVVAPKSDNTAIRNEKGQIIAVTGFVI